MFTQKIVLTEEYGSLIVQRINSFNDLSVITFKTEEERNEYISAFTDYCKIKDYKLIIEVK